MQFDFSRWGPLTVLAVTLVVIGAITGAAVVITNPVTLDFDSYLSTLSKFVLGLGLFGVGHGVVHAATKLPAVAGADVDDELEPGATDALPHLPVRKSSPRDKGDAGNAEVTA